MGKSLDDVPLSIDDRWEQKIEWEQFLTTELMQYRMLGSIFVFARHWVNTKPHDVENGKKFPRECTNFNQETEESDSDYGCPCCEAELADVWKTSKHYISDGINRDLQQQGMRRPIRALGPLPPGCLTEIIKLKKLNRDRKLNEEEGTHVNDGLKGRDIWIGYDDNQSGAKKWTIQISPDARTPLTDDEKAYALHNFEEIYPNFKDEEVREAYNASTRRSMKRCGYYGEVPAKETAEPEEVAPDAEPPRKLKQVNLETEEKAEPVQEVKSTATPAPAEEPAKAKLASTPTPAQQAVTEPAAASAKADPRCPHPDEGVKFGDFQGDVHCMKCSFKSTCIDAGG